MTDRRSPYQQVLQEATADNKKDTRPESEDFHDTKGLLSPDTPRSDWDQTAYQPYSSYTSKVNSPAPQSATQAYFPQDDSVCHAKNGYRKHHTHWSTISIILLAVYSTIFSGIWLGLALSKPYYPFIGTEGGISPTVASTIVAAFAKSIELAYVTVFVAFLGQYLSRKALSAHSNGITLADMQLRTFLLQPGLILQSWHSFHYTARTLLGVFAMVAAFVALIYTTASDALVSPKPNLRTAETKLIEAPVWTDFANNNYIRSQCPTPISTLIDPEFAGSTCSAIEHSGQAFHNYLQYLASWTTFPARTMKRDDDQWINRPDPIGMLYENTTAQGSWLFKDEVPPVQKQGNRRVNNVTMAMPHSGVYTAAMDTLQQRPQLTSGDADSRLRMEAQVVSPAINVLCADMTADELEPIIFAKWPEHHGDMTIYSNFTTFIPSDWRNKTAVDDLFGFSDQRTPPVFPKMPIMFNTVFNQSSVDGIDAIYLLTAYNSSNVTQYNMCSMSMSLEQGCSTELSVDVTGGNIRTYCDAKRPLAYTSDSPSGIRSLNWPFVGADWGQALSLGSGITDGAASNARLLSQLVPLNDTADPNQPTIAEALAVMSSCTILVGSPGAPFNQDWVDPKAEHTNLEIKNPPAMQSFKALVQTSGYNSGATMAWQNMFNVVLVLVFLISFWCLCYFCHIIRVEGLVNDFMEYPNMFALALHSPADRRLAGTAASGPETHQLIERWFIKEDYNHEVFIGDGKRRRGHTSWMSHAPRSHSAVQLQDLAFDKQDGKPLKTYEPTMKDAVRRTLGGLGIRHGKQKAKKSPEPDA